MLQTSLWLSQYPLTYRGHAVPCKHTQLLDLIQHQVPTCIFTLFSWALSASSPNFTQCKRSKPLWTYPWSFWGQAVSKNFSGQGQSNLTSNRSKAYANIGESKASCYVHSFYWQQVERWDQWQLPSNIPWSRLIINSSLFCRGVCVLS